MKTRNYLLILAILLAALLGACSPPRMIAAYPKVTPIARYPVPPGNAPHAFLQVQAADVDQAAQRATQRVSDFGGYASSSQSWYTNDGKVVALELVVPATNFERLCQALLGLGTPLHQVYSSLPEPGHYGDPYIAPATITLQLHPTRGIWPPTVVEPGGWSPLYTLQRAFGVFMTVFGFLVDILIWVLVVVGPFILLGLGARALVQRMRKPAPPDSNQPS